MEFKMVFSNSEMDLKDIFKRWNEGNHIDDNEMTFLIAGLEHARDLCIALDLGKPLQYYLTVTLSSIYAAFSSRLNSERKI